MTHEEIRALPMGTTFGKCPKCGKPARFFHYTWMGYHGCDHVEITHVSNGGFDCEPPDPPRFPYTHVRDAYLVFMGLCLGAIIAISVLTAL